MSPEQVRRVQASFTLVVPIAEQAAALFYGRLFEIAPEARRLFSGDIEEQGRKLMAAITAVVDNLDNVAAIAPTVENLAKRHVGYGVRAEHYPVVGEALLWTLQQGLGEHFTPPVKEAWATAYGALAGMMIAAAYSAEQGPAA